LIVEVSGHKLVFPPSCACCGGPAQGTFTAVATRTTGIRVVRTASKSWAFPYCGECIGHVRAHQTAKAITVGLLAASAVTAALLASSTGVGALGVCIGILGVGGSLAVGSVLKKNALAMCKGACTCVGPAVGYTGWYGATHSFEIASPHYAFSFMHANKPKLINVAPQVWDWLHQGNPPIVQQTARRSFY
jgi:hypothetical protein